MTKARGAADSIGKAGRGASFQRFLRITFRAYFPLFLRARARAHRHAPTAIYICTYIYMHASHRTPAFSFLSVVPLVSVDLLSYPSPRPPHQSPSASPPRLFHRLRPSRHISDSTCVCVCVRLYMYIYMYVRLVSIVVRGFMSRGSTLSRREGGFVRG